MSLTDFPLYTGVGGAALAAHIAGIEPVAFCEQDAYCRRVLARHWPAVPCFESDEEVSRDAFRQRGIPIPTIVSGGPPCQGFSVAGKRKGAEDPRNRWPVMRRIVAELRPAWVCVENVFGFLPYANGVVLPDLEALGYECLPPLVYPVSAFGAPHQRMRAFVVAHAEQREGGNGYRADVFGGRAGDAEQTRLGGGDLPPGGERGRDMAADSGGSDVSTRRRGEGGTVMEYRVFLDRKRHHGTGDGFDPLWMPDFLFPFQRRLVEWAVKQGRGALFADCGLGKTPMQLAWAENVRRHTGKSVLIVTPLAVTFQVEAEAAKFGLEAAISRDGHVAAGITVTNYDRLHHFDASDFGGVVCDESSAIKAFDGVLRATVTEFLREHRYRLLCTATAAPNDYTELGTSSEALGYLGHVDMLSRFFTNQHGTSYGGRSHGAAAAWRFKGHAEEPFWRWVSSWARALRRPSDMGESDEGFSLPPLRLRQHTVRASKPRDGELFELPAIGLQEEREELRRTLAERCEKAAFLLADAERGVAWCHLNAEGDLLTRLIEGAVQVAGSDTPEDKEAKLLAFSRGEIRVLVTKPAIGAWGLNWQHCHRMTFFPSHSYEQYYQAVRRSWRFGQTQPVTVDIVASEGMANALKNLQRKADQADKMFDALTRHMHRAQAIRAEDPHTRRMEVPAWL
jgi:hypothetical protein